MLSMIFICLGEDSENLMIRAFHDLIDDEVIYENKRKSLEDVGVRMSREIEVGAQINKIRNEKGEVTNDTTEIQRIIRDH